MEKLAMDSQYFTECQQGHRVPVELFQAGITVICPVCKSETSVPNTLTLKKNSGDKYPLLVPIDKIRRQIEAKEPPFDGICVACDAAAAEVAVPIIYRSLIERVLDNDGGIRLGLTGIQFTASGGVESWDIAEIPLLLCDPCFRSFEIEHRFQKQKRRALSISLMLLLIGFLALCYFQMELVAALSGLLWIVGLFAWIAGLQGKKRVDPCLEITLKKIRWLKDAVAQSTELELSVGQPCHLNPKESISPHCG
jgi:hypothetical protein